MAIETVKTISAEERKELVAKLREFHQPYFETIGEPNADFTAKMLYGYPPSRASFFESELSSKKNLYVEWVSKTYVPEDNRRLYRYIPNPNFKNEYETQTKNKLTWFIVPIERFELVKDPNDNQLEMDFEMVNPDEDALISELTIRDLACILLKKPVSRKQWLNKLITKDV